MRSIIFLSVFVSGLCLTLAGAGCGPTDAPAVTTDMNEDFDHDHTHQHGEGHDHEHEHGEGYKGTHSHPHSHSHRHGEPLHGGRIVSIGHTHHKGGATHYHAEVMPIVDDRIEFHVLTETKQGKSIDLPLDDVEITGYVNVPKGDPALAHEVTFSVSEDDESSSKLTAAVPEDFRDVAKLFVVVPKIVLGGERLNFNFTALQSSRVDDGDVEAAGAVEEASP